eukprot:6783241-Karenia_brevis.AAC.1
MITFRVTAEPPWIRTAKETMTTFQSTQRAYKDKSEEEKSKLREPAAWMFNAAMKEVMTNSTNLNAQEKEAMFKSVLTRPAKGGLQFILDQVPHFKIARVHQSDVKK